MNLSMTTDEGFSYVVPVSCLKYSRITKTWVLFSKSTTKRKPFPIPSEVAESLLKEGGTTRHDKGDYVLFQVNASEMFVNHMRTKEDFDISKLL